MKCFRSGSGSGSALSATDTEGEWSKSGGTNHQFMHIATGFRLKIEKRDKEDVDRLQAE